MQLRSPVKFLSMYLPRMMLWGSVEMMAERVWGWGLHVSILSAVSTSRGLLSDDRMHDKQKGE
jgi:hypothetical protein